MRVLVVEDEVPLATALAEGLRGEGHSVDVASDGAEGLWLTEENDYDVIVLDLMLPVLDGFEVCRRLRSARNWTPVLMLTARDADPDMVDGWTPALTITSPNPSASTCSWPVSGLWPGATWSKGRRSSPWPTCTWIPPPARYGATVTSSPPRLGSSRSSNT